MKSARTTSSDSDLSPQSSVFSPLTPDLALEDLEPGVPVSVALSDGRRVCVLRVGDQVYALADQCSHQAMPLSAGYCVSPNDSADAPEIECAWHGARFRCTTGEPTRGPALDAVPVYEVRIEDGRVLIGEQKTSQPG